MQGVQALGFSAGRHFPRQSLGFYTPKQYTAPSEEVLRARGSRPVCAVGALGWGDVVILVHFWAPWAVLSKPVYLVGRYFWVYLASPTRWEAGADPSYCCK